MRCRRKCEDTWKSQYSCRTKVLEWFLFNKILTGQDSVHISGITDGFLVEKLVEFDSKPQVKLGTLKTMSHFDLRESQAHFPYTLQEMSLTQVLMDLNLTC